jgi:DNA integrity scanning protein DisA with diadenylate cyclase activity
MQTRMFMWRWQHTFQDAVKNLFESILQILELPIALNVFVIGIPISEQNVPQILFHHADCGFTGDDFQQVFSLAKENFDQDPEQLFFKSASHLNQAHKDSLYPKALRSAIQSILQQYDRQRSQISFCSLPIQKNDHWILTVIQLQQPDFNCQYRLNKATHELHSMREYRIDRCFLEALIYQVLKEGELELQSSSAGNILSLGNSERVIEDAANSLLQSIEVHISQWQKVDLLSFANAIAAERYEGAASEGRLIICPKDHPDIAAKVKLAAPIKIYNYRGIRKLLEVSSNKMALLCDIETVWGLGLPLDTYQPSRENLFEIRFAEYQTWELVHAENIMLRVKYRQARLPRARFDRQLFCNHVEQLFQVNSTTVNLLVKAVEAAVEQRHGTMLVITPEAESETQRLAAQSTVIEPVIVSQGIISHLSSVDGAILLSPEGIIHSFGVILDGQASKNGNSARGARYNSAIRYVDEMSHKVNCLALIVSEDGYVDLYSTLTNQLLK